MGEHHRHVEARRAALVHLLSDAALPRRLAALDAWLEAECDALAGEREYLAGLPLPAPGDDLQARVGKRYERDRARQTIADRLHRIGTCARHRAEVAARFKVWPASVLPPEVPPSLLGASWRGFSPLG